MKKIFGASITVWHYTFGVTIKARKWKLSTSLHFDPKSSDGLPGAFLVIWLLGYCFATAAGREND